MRTTRHLMGHTRGRCELLLDGEGNRLHLADLYPDETFTMGYTSKRYRPTDSVRRERGGGFKKVSVYFGAPDSFYQGRTAHQLI